jgi:hypothetical protein
MKRPELKPLPTKPTKKAKDTDWVQWRKDSDKIVRDNNKAVSKYQQEVDNLIASLPGTLDGIGKRIDALEKKK